MKSLVFPSASRTRYWAEAIFLSIAGIYIGHYLNEHQVWLESRFAIYRVMQGMLQRKPDVQHSVIITVDDEDYWNGPFERRSPIKRDMLALVLDRLVELQAATVAIDFDLRSPLPDGAIKETALYQPETGKLVASVKGACSKRTSVVLPATLGRNLRGRLERVSDIYSGVLSESAQLQVGYIALNQDTRFIQLGIELEGTKRLHSFAMAAVCAYRKSQCNGMNTVKVFPFGGFLPKESFDRISVKSLLADTHQDLLDRIRGKLVFVGADWSRLAFKTGGTADSHPTPVGPIPGVFIHANYAEAILTNNKFNPLPEWASYVIEMVTLLLLAFLLEKFTDPFRSMAIVLLAFLGFLAVGYLLLANLNIYFDFLVPAIFLFLHYFFHQVLEWRRLAREYIRTTSVLHHGGNPSSGLNVGVSPP